MLGELGESDTALKRKYRRGIAKNSNGTVDAIASAFLLREDVIEDVLVVDNTTERAANIQGLEVNPGVTAIIVRWKVPGSLELFNEIANEVLAPGSARIYREAVAVDVTANVDTSGISLSAARAARAAVRDRLQKKPGDIATISDLLFRAKNAVSLLEEDPESILSVTITPPGGRSVTSKYASDNVSGLRLYEYINVTQVT